MDHVDTFSYLGTRSEREYTAVSRGNKKWRIQRATINIRPFLRGSKNLTGSWCRDFPRRVDASPVASMKKRNTRSRRSSSVSHLSRRIMVVRRFSWPRQARKTLVTREGSETEEKPYSYGAILQKQFDSLRKKGENLATRLPHWKNTIFR